MAVRSKHLKMAVRSSSSNWSKQGVAWREPIDAGCIVAAECLQWERQARLDEEQAKLFGTFGHCAPVNLAGEAPLFTLHVSSCCWRIAATDWIKTLAFSPFLAAGFPEPFTAPLNFSVEHRLLFNVAVLFFKKNLNLGTSCSIWTHTTLKDPSKFGVVFEHSKFP